jgi:hypothetical protein
MTKTFMNKNFHIIGLIDKPWKVTEGIIKTEVILTFPDCVME